MCQRSPCDSRHTTCDAMHEHIAERGETECMACTPSTPLNHGLYGDQDSDDSLSAGYEVTNGDTGTRYDVPKDVDEHSECSEDSTNMSNTWSDMYGPSVHSDQQSEASNDMDEEPDQGSDMVSVTSEPTGQSSEID